MCDLYNKILLELDECKHETLCSEFFSIIRKKNSIEEIMSYILSLKLAEIYDAKRLSSIFANIYSNNPYLVEHLKEDCKIILERDPACEKYLYTLFFLKGYHALQTHRLAHYFWQNKEKSFALYLQSLSSSKFGVDIHPQVKMGHRIFIDHASSIVIGQTSIIGNDVSIFQNVTLGGTGKEKGDRHPKICDNVLISCGAKILGNITIGEHARIAAGSVVLKDVPANKTVAGVPAKIVGESPKKAYKRMEHDFTICKR